MPAGTGGGPGATLAALLPPPLSGRWLIAGTRLSATATPSATVWTSPDAATWTAAPIAAGEGPSQATAAARYDSTTVVVGSVGEGANQQATVWLSAAPGQPFAAVQVPLTGGPSSMSLVAAGALGYFATGTIDGRPAMWSSTNGRDWFEDPAAEKAISSSPGARVNALVAAGDKVFAGGSVLSGGQQSAAIWSTVDGLHWQLVQTAQTAFTGADSRVVYSLAPLGTGLVAVGAIDVGTRWLPASWISPDGASWSQPSTDFPSPGAAATPALVAGMAARSVSAVPTLAGATSVVAAGGGPYGQAAWSSTDGIHWTALALPRGAASATGWQATLVAGTTTATVVADGQPGQAHVLSDEPSGWQEPSADASVFGPVRPVARPLQLRSTPAGLVLSLEVTTAPQAIGTPVASVAYLLSKDGVTWSPVSVAAAVAAGAVPANLPGPRVSALRLPSGWIAAGGNAVGGNASWTSPTGATWTAGSPIDGPPAAPTPGQTAPVSVVDGLCQASATSAAAVGATYSVPPGATTSGPGRTGPAGALTGAAAWYFNAASGWRRGTVAPTAAPESMAGCTPVGSGLVAFGSSVGPTGQTEPGVWRSGLGIAWTRQSVGAFTDGPPAPLVGLAAYGEDWVAVANPDPTAGTVAVAASTAPATTGAAAPDGSDSAVGPNPSLENGLQGVWLSPDGGGTWQLVDTSTSPWLASQAASVDLVGFAGPTPVVVGVQDDRLAVWVGSPTLGSG